VVSAVLRPKQEKLEKTLLDYPFDQVVEAVLYEPKKLRVMAGDLDFVN
jgi:hypothetical protein